MAQGRTSDIVPSIQVLAAQVLSLLQLPTEKRQAENPETKEVIKLELSVDNFARFGTEEVLRRMIKKTVNAPTGKELLDCIIGDR